MIKNKIFFIAIVTSFFLFNSMSPKEDWKLYKSIDGVSIYTKVESHLLNNIKTNYRIFKYINNNRYSVTVTWKLNLWYNGVCRACDLKSPNEYEMNLILKSGETQTGNAGNKSKIFSVFHSAEGMAPLDKFEFEKLSITAKK